MTVLFNNVNVAAGVASDDARFQGEEKIATIRADDFGGGTLVLQALSVNDGTAGRWDNLADGAFTTNAQVRVNFGSTTLSFRAQLIGGSGATNVFVEIA